MNDLNELLKENRLSDSGLENFLEMMSREWRYKIATGSGYTYDVKELVLYELVARELERNTQLRRIYTVEENKLEGN